VKSFIYNERPSLISVTRPRRGSSLRSMWRGAVRDTPRRLRAHPPPADLRRMIAREPPRANRPQATRAYRPLPRLVRLRMSCVLKAACRLCRSVEAVKRNGCAQGEGESQIYNLDGLLLLSIESLPLKEVHPSIEHPQWRQPNQGVWRLL
jgi:hypothetical protein